MSTSHQITCFSPAKVNLCLRVVGRRTDGYHLLDSVFAAISLRDRLDIHVSDVGPGRAVEVTVACGHPGVPNDSTNLAARAAVDLLGACRLGGRVAISIDKHIPPGAGLGGGSSNAATVLRMLADTLRLTVDAEALHALALGLGADVPFFLSGGCARVRGIGEDVHPIPGWPGLTLVVVLPAVAVSTAWAFRSLRREATAPGDEPARLAAATTPSPAHLVNDLETVVLPAFPAVAAAKCALLEAGASGAVMSGSGAAVVGLVRSPAEARTVASTYAARQPETGVHCVRILDASAPLSVDPAGSYA